MSGDGTLNYAELVTGGGSGLGLFVVRTILDKYGIKESLSYHDGTFSVEISSR